MQDFESFLDLIEMGGTGAEAALFLTARHGEADVDDEGMKQAPGSGTGIAYLENAIDQRVWLP